MNKVINIVSFDVPYPPNYGGVIDVFFKIKALNKLGIKIILHTFKYGRDKNNILDKYCDKVFYYERNKNFKKIISRLPFIVKSRISQSLISNLNSNDFPILFEGLHTTYPLTFDKFKNRKTIVRTHNIEHKYYIGLSRSESTKVKKLYFYTESIKLKRFQPILNKANFVLSISKNENNYFKKELNTKIEYIPAFHQNDTFKNLIGKSNYALFHGDLNVSDNLKACSYLCEVFKELNYKLIIAGNTNNKELINKLKSFSNVDFFNKVNSEKLENLIKNAHINILPTFQNTGIKLKLINSLFMGRFCLVNNKMVEKTGLEQLCKIANTKKEFRSKILEIKDQNFTESEVLKRKQILTEFDNLKNAQKIIDLLF